jgi:hypothetical protein
VGISEEKTKSKNQLFKKLTYKYATINVYQRNPNTKIHIKEIGKPVTSLLVKISNFAAIVLVKKSLDYA